MFFVLWATLRLWDNTHGSPKEFWEWSNTRRCQQVNKFKNVQTRHAAEGKIRDPRAAGVTQGAGCACPWEGKNTSWRVLCFPLISSQSCGTPVLWDVEFHGIKSELDACRDKWVLRKMYYTKYNWAFSSILWFCSPQCSDPSSRHQAPSMEHSGIVLRCRATTVPYSFPKLFMSRRNQQ